MLRIVEVIMLPYLFLAIAVAVRFMPHPWTFTPVAASLLFFGARGSRRFLWVPLLALAASDVILTKVVYGSAFNWDQLVTWAWYAAILWLGTRLKGITKPLPIVGAALASSVSFFVISNFAVWAVYDMYPKTFAGLMTSYTLGLPFFRQGVEGDLMFTSIFFTVPVILAAIAGASDRKGDHTASA